MRTVFWMACEDIPIRKYPSLINLQTLNESAPLSNLSIAKNATYTSRAAGEELQESIAEVVHENSVNKIKHADMFSVLVDESTDISVSKQMVVYVRIIDENFEPQTIFLKNITISEPRSDAQVLFNNLCSLLEQEGLSFSKLKGFGSDGAAVMVGRKSGVATKVKEKSPHCVNIHCMAHRFNLSTSQATKNIPVLKDFESILSDLYYYFGGSKSGNRASELQEIQKVLEHPQLKVKECHEIRWLAFYEAVFAVFRCWGSLITYFKQHDDKKSKSFLEKLSDYKFVAIMYMFMDILPSVSQMSLILQKQDIDIAAINPALSDLKDKIKQAKKGKAFYQREFTNKISIRKDKSEKVKEVVLKGHKLGLEKSLKEVSKEVEEVRDNFCEKLSNNISDRFPRESVDVSTAFHIFGLRPLSFLTDEQKEEYGSREIDILLTHYGSEKKVGEVVSKPMINAEACRAEWSVAKKIAMDQMYPRDSTKILWKLMYMHHRESLPNLMILANLALIMPYQTADCERGFSCQNGIKTSRRSRMKEKSMNILMTIKVEGGSVETYDFSKAVHAWKTKKNRRIFSDVKQ